MSRTVDSMSICPAFPPSFIVIEPVPAFTSNSVKSIYPNNSTVDLLVGGQSTTAAQFAITGIADDAPIATLSGSTGNGFVIDAENTTIQGLQNDLLTIGGATTGNIILSPLNGASGSILEVNSIDLTLTGTTTLTGSSLTTITGGGNGM